MENEKKPIKARPVFYAHCYEALKEIARDNGYNLLINGSLNRDFDLVAIPWSNNPIRHIELLKLFSTHLGVLLPVDGQEETHYRYAVLPGGRFSYTIDLNRGGAFNGYVDEQYYLDISFTPQICEKDKEIEELKAELQERDSPCPDCLTGCMVLVGFTKPSGRTDYKCDRCGHEETFP